jgi:hypothetical protein
VLAFVRAPFTRFDEDTQRGEVSESARGTGVQRTARSRRERPGRWRRCSPPTRCPTR